MTTNTIPTDLMQLAGNAYNEPNLIPTTFTTYYDRTWNITWGPAFIKGDLDTIVNLIYMAQLANTDTYAIVIRGTSPTSTKAWKEDFEVHTQEPWSNIVPSGSGNVAEGTMTGINNLISLGLTGPTSQQTPIIYVTGHSLGGTLTPAYADYYQYEFGYSVQPYSFAGLPPGDGKFASYLDKFEGKWRYWNDYDVAPMLWCESVDTIADIYDGATIPIKMDPIEKGLLEMYYEKLPQYKQPNGSGYKLSGAINTTLDWDKEAEYQHSHIESYIPLMEGKPQG